MGAFVTALALAAAALPAAGCLRSTTFTCATDQECSGGTCETNNYCSFADTTCASGRRYGDLSGDVANQCVGDEPPDIDGPPGTPDAPPGTPDAPSSCPATFLPVANAPNVYLHLTATRNWVEQQVDCVNAGGYLVIPNNQPELDAMTALAGAPIWVGISDRTSENTWLDVRGATATFLPWSGGQPDNASPGEDCVLATGSSISDERCMNVDAPTVCECEP